MSTNPIPVYIAYAPEDASLLHRLRIQLAAVERIGLIDAWHDEEVDIGSDREQAMLNALEQAPIIILLVSADFLASEFAYEQELTRALQLQTAGKAQVFPVILRECTWKYTPLADLQVLPEGGIPVTNEYWHNPDRAFVQVVEAVVKATQQEPKEAVLSNPVKTDILQEPDYTKLSKNQTTFGEINLNGLRWMDKNLALKVAGEGCWEAEDQNYFYDHKTAMANCPPGWRLPTKAEWAALTETQVAQLGLSANGLYDRGYPRDQGRKGYYWSSDYSHGGEAWCFEQTKGQLGQIGSRYVHWGMNCRCVRIR